MQVEKAGKGKVMVFGGTVHIAVTDEIFGLITQVKHLTRQEHTTIIADGGLATRDSVDDKTVLNTAMSFVQNAWFEAAGKPVSETVQEAHAARVARYLAVLHGETTASQEDALELLDPEIAQLVEELQNKCEEKKVALCILLDDDEGEQTVFGFCQDSTLHHMLEVWHRDRALVFLNNGTHETESEPTTGPQLVH